MYLRISVLLLASAGVVDYAAAAPLYEALPPSPHTLPSSPRPDGLLPREVTEVVPKVPQHATLHRRNDQTKHPDYDKRPGGPNYETNEQRLQNMNDEINRPAPPPETEQQWTDRMRREQEGENSDQGRFLREENRNRRTLATHQTNGGTRAPRYTHNHGTHPPEGTEQLTFNHPHFNRLFTNRRQTQPLRNMQGDEYNEDDPYNIQI